MEQFQRIAESWRVIYLGSFSKSMLPTLRLGFLVAPPPLFPALRNAKLVTDWNPAMPMQEALAQFIDDGQFAQHIRRMRRIYEQRHQLIVSVPDSGSANCSIGSRRWPEFTSPRCYRSGLLFGYGAIPTEQIADGLKRLYECCLYT